MFKLKVIALLCAMCCCFICSGTTFAGDTVPVTKTNTEVSYEETEVIIQSNNSFGDLPERELQKITRSTTTTSSFVIENETEVDEVEDELSIYIEEIASMYGLDAELVHAIIMVESNYDANALSSANCMGLMQISPRWHADRMERLGVTNLYDPYGNVLVGCDFLAELLEDYDLEFALMIYNQGLDSARRTYASTGQSNYSKTVIEKYQNLLMDNQ